MVPGQTAKQLMTREVTQGEQGAQCHRTILIIPSHYSVQIQNV